jgi:hypothetical protein
VTTNLPRRSGFHDRWKSCKTANSLGAPHSVHSPLLRINNSYNMRTALATQPHNSLGCCCTPAAKSQALLPGARAVRGPPSVSLHSTQYLAHASGAAAGCIRPRRTGTGQRGGEDRAHQHLAVVASTHAVWCCHGVVRAALQLCVVWDSRRAADTLAVVAATSCIPACASHLLLWHSLHALHAHSTPQPPPNSC